MEIFYRRSEGRTDVPADSPVAVSLDTALAIFRGLESGSGFAGIPLNERFVLQICREKRGRVQVELLDTSIPAFDYCDAEIEFAESLIRAAAEGRDVFQIARAGNYEWKHLNLA